MEIATLAGGCFWCTEAIFKKLKGVTEVTPGYTDQVETIQISFDPKTISFEKLLEVFFATHDPTTVNQQGADIGTQYRSVVFYHSDNQKQVAQKSKEEAQKYFSDKIVTEITQASEFYPAAEEHRDFYEKNKSPMYCRLVIDPKIQKLYKDFKKDLKE